MIPIEAKDDKWVLVSNSGAYYLKDNMSNPYAILEPNNFYTIMKSKDNTKILIHCYQYLDIKDYMLEEITIGKENCLINHQLLENQTVQIKSENNQTIL